MTSKKEKFYIQRISELEAQLKERDQRIATLEKQVAELLKANEALVKKNAELAEKIAKLSKTRDSHEWRSLKPYIGLFRNYWRFHAPIDEIPLNTVVASFNDKRACHFLHTFFVIKVGVFSA